MGLFFSEYIEGGGNNKAIEIANFTGSAVDLTGYSLDIYFNGNTSPNTTIALGGNTIADRDVFVIADDGADDAIKTVADLLPGDSFFNGNDAVILSKDGAIVDAIGQIGTDPGSQWGSGNTSTQNNTIRRLSSVTEGDTNASDAFDVSLQWIGFANDTFDGLGRHTPVTLIHTIQGTGETSPLDGQTVMIEAIVVGDFQDGDADDGRNLQGFYVQEEDSDADTDALTSEGMFVFENGDFIADVSVGDTVSVTGTVNESDGETRIDTVTDIAIVSSGNTLPTAATISLPAAATTTRQNGDLQPDLEAFEGMLVTFPQTLTITEMFQLDRFNEIKLSQDRPAQFTQTNAPDVTGYQAHLETIGSRTIVYDDGLNSQNELIANLDGFGATFNTATDIRMGDTIASLSGVLSYQWAENSSSDATWRVRSTQAGENSFTKANTRAATPNSVGGSLKVASFNLENYFPTLASRGASSSDEFDRQTEKLVNTIQAIDADVLAFVELENDFQAGSSGNAIEHLVDELNLDAGAETYARVDPNAATVGNDAIAVGAIYKPASVSLAAGTSPAILADADLSGLGLGSLPAVFDGSGTNRSPLAVTFSENSSGEVFTVVVNHLKSKSSAGTAGAADDDQGDGAGLANQTRLNGVTALNAWLATDPTGSGDEDILILGDLNAYAEETPITTLEGFGYTNLARQFIGANAYSFVFDGQTGTLDYALANASLQSQVTGATEWHINADEADALDYNLDFGRDADIFDGATPYRSSDHDPLIVGLNLSTEPEVPETTAPPPSSTGGAAIESEAESEAESETETDIELETPETEIVTAASNPGSSIDFSGLIREILESQNPSPDPSSDPSSNVTSTTTSNTTSNTNSASAASSSRSETTPASDQVIRPATDETDDIIAALAGDDTVNSSGGNDRVNGNHDRDRIDLGTGNDIGFGGQEDDTINGGSGDDFISGDRGNDQLTGGDGVDTFLIRTGDGADILTDFTLGEDKLAIVEVLTEPDPEIPANDLINNFPIGEDRRGTVRQLDFADLSLSTDGTLTTIRFNDELLATLNGVTSLGASDFTELSLEL